MSLDSRNHIGVFVYYLKTLKVTKLFRRKSSLLYKGWYFVNCILLVPNYTWWRHQMETFSALLAICAGNSPGNSQRPVTRSFDVFFGLLLNKRLSEQSWGWWFETLWHPLWRLRNATTSIRVSLWKDGIHCMFCYVGLAMSFDRNTPSSEHHLGSPGVKYSKIYQITRNATKRKSSVYLIWYIAHKQRICCWNYTFSVSQTISTSHNSISCHIFLFRITKFCSVGLSCQTRDKLCPKPHPLPDWRFSDYQAVYHPFEYAYLPGK